MTFSPNSRHLAYVIHGGGDGFDGYAMCVDGVQVTDGYNNLYKDTAPFPLFSAGRINCSST